MTAGFGLAGAAIAAAGLAQPIKSDSNGQQQNNYQLRVPDQNNENQVLTNGRN